MLTAVRAAWLALALLAGPALAGALDGAPTALVVVAVVLAAAGWGTGVVAVLVPRSLGLTGVRVLAPLALAGAIACSVASSVGAAEVVALVAGAGVTALVLVGPGVADAFVDGSSYGDERRFALRVPVAVLAGPAELAWLALVLPVGGALLVAGGSPIAGAALLVLGGAGAWPALGSLHQLSRRWVVFVPAGVVLHDPLALADPMLFPKRMVRTLRAAEVGDEAGAIDVSRGAPGLVLALELTEPTTVGLVQGRKTSESAETTRLLFAPCRPGALLAEARTRNL